LPKLVIKNTSRNILTHRDKGVKAFRALRGLMAVRGIKAVRIV